MRTLDELIDIKDRFIKKVINSEEVKFELWHDYKEGNRSWYTKDWKERRPEFLKDKCEICQGTDILTLQHLKHPLKYNEYRQEILKDYTSQYLDTCPHIDTIEFSNFIDQNYDFKPNPLCPKCFCSKISKRTQKQPIYLCSECRNEFDIPAHEKLEDLIIRFLSTDGSLYERKKYFIPKKFINKQSSFGQVKYWFLSSKVENIYSNQIDYDSLMTYLNNVIKYLSFEDTITACKKCASYYDLYDLELCPICKSHYKGVKYNSCIPCLPEDKRITALAKVEFGKQFQETHKYLEID